MQGRILSDHVAAATTSTTTWHCRINLHPFSDQVSLDGVDGRRAHGGIVVTVDVRLGIESGRLVFKGSIYACEAFSDNVVRQIHVKCQAKNGSVNLALCANTSTLERLCIHSFDHNISWMNVVTVQLKWRSFNSAVQNEAAKWRRGLVWIAGAGQMEGPHIECWTRIPWLGLHVVDRICSGVVTCYYSSRSCKCMF
jgi:hypothetical protein